MSCRWPITHSPPRSFSDDTWLDLFPISALWCCGASIEGSLGTGEAGKGERAGGSCGCLYIDNPSNSALTSIVMIDRRRALCEGAALCLVENRGVRLFGGATREAAPKAWQAM